MQWLCDFILGFVSGYLTATISESFFHARVGHASRRARLKWRKIPTLNNWLVEMHFGHAIVHHGKTYRHSHVTQFRTSSEQAQLDRELANSERTRFIRLQYGLVTDLSGAVYYMLAPTFSCLAISHWFIGMQRPLFWFAAIPWILSTPLLSMVLHPHLHRPVKEVLASESAIICWLLTSRYGRWVRIHHFTHHRTPRWNFNLLPGGDFILRTHRSVTPKELDEMRQIGLL